jgi:hypothetical protein
MPETNRVLRFIFETLKTLKSQIVNEMYNSDIAHQ